MTRAAAVSFLNRLRPITASTKRSVPSASKGVACKRSPSSLAIGRPRCALWSAGFVPKCKLARSPPFCATAPGAPPAAASSPSTSRPGDDSRRRGSRVEPCSGTSPAHARRGGVSLPALVGPCALRSPGQPSQLSGLRDGSRDQGVVELARPEAAGQRTAPPHQRLYLRRGRWLVCGPQCAPQEILRDRLLLSHHTRPSAKVTLGLDRRHGAPLLFPQANTCALDLHPIPFRGDATGLDQHYLPRRGKAGTRVLSFFAQEHESRVLCDATANLTRRDQAGEALQFVEFWQELTGVQPQWLYFDSTVVP